MKILITGAKGFIGKNLVTELRNRKYEDIIEYDTDDKIESLEESCKDIDFVFHLAGVNRPLDVDEFMQGNFGFTSQLLDLFKSCDNTCPVMISSSIQAKLDNAYGISKKAGEDLLFTYGGDTGAKVLVYRFPNVFGKWSRPNYNSAIATFCHNTAHGMDIVVNDPSVVMSLVYIDDVVGELISALEGSENRVEEFCQVPVVHEVELGKIAELIRSFSTSRTELSIPDMSDLFVSKLYSTYLSFLPKDKFSYELNMNVDNRGSFTEFLRTEDRGQVSINVSKPGIVKGNHWHHSKNEKFLVVSGTGVIRFRRVDTDNEEVIEYRVSGDKLEVVDIPTGYTHNIENIGENDLVTVMWANEPFNKDKPDTHFLEV
ncbi:MAG: NAD-dependent epimerase/dehydratase [Fusobacteria bacterium]|nr:MAG: NAD-dependent epimerase/dehydratase [Fusobacteriota bacterium]KAF0229254.1 MAG: NAD-dependent [Fusobacteriota bacterium]